MVTTNRRGHGPRGEMAYLLLSRIVISRRKASWHRRNRCQGLGVMWLGKWRVSKSSCVARVKAWRGVSSRTMPRRVVRGILVTQTP